jgi:hypothetical protein
MPWSDVLEIDALAADPHRDRLWVCEVKDPSIAVSPSAVAIRAALFLKPRGYVSRLLRNTRDVQADPTSWAQYPWHLTQYRSL